MDMEQRFYLKVGKVDGVFIIFVQVIVVVVVDKQVELLECIGFFLLFVYYGWLFGFFGLVVGLCYGIFLQMGFVVDFIQLFDVLFIYELVFYIMQQVGYLIDVVDFFE